jgi:dihydroxy-acid dehydratase
MGRIVPTLAEVRPNGAVRIEQFEDAGGARAMLKQLEPLLDRDVIVASGRTMGDDLADAQVGDADIIRPLDNPVSPGPSIAILRGSLAPQSAVVKLGIRDGSRPESFAGTALVFDSTQEAMKAIDTGTLRKGHVMVLRGQGLKGGPAMGGGASHVLFAIDAAGLAKDVAFVTDGQLSGLCLKGLTIAEVAPEAAAGGPIGKVRDGDAIEIDVAARRMDLLVPTEELARRPGPSNTYAEPAEGWLGLYRANVQSMATGAVLGDVTRQGE